MPTVATIHTNVIMSNSTNIKPDAFSPELYDLSPNKFSTKGIISNSPIIKTQIVYENINKTALNNVFIIVSLLNSTVNIATANATHKNMSSYPLSNTPHWLNIVKTDVSKSTIMPPIMDLSIQKTVLFII